MFRTSSSGKCGATDPEADDVACCLFLGPAVLSMDANSDDERRPAGGRAPIDPAKPLTRSIVSNEVVSNLHTDFEESGDGERSSTSKQHERCRNRERNGCLERASELTFASLSLSRNRLPPPHDAHNTRKGGSTRLVGYV
jgi:hypothetical protein